jgi:broad specificity phosphatase PhoE
VLLLVRHGESEANAEGLLAGRREWALTARGRDQAAAVGRAVASIRRIVVSPSGRARETARLVCEGHGDVPVTVDDRWAELDYGDLDGTPLTQVPESLWRSWWGDTTFTPPGGESLADLGRRVRQAMAELVADAAAAATDEHLVVVSHVSPIKAAVAWALGVDDAVSWRLHLSPGSITVIGWRSSGPVLHAYNVRPGDGSVR